MLKDFHTIKTVDENMWFTDSHVFIVPTPCTVLKSGLMPKKARAFVDSIRPAPAGKCWMVPVRLGDPDDWFQFRYSQPRTVWFAVIPYEQNCDDLRESLMQLRQWVLASGLPLRIAIDYEMLYPESLFLRNIAIEHYGYNPSARKDVLYRLFADAIGDLDVTIYRPSKSLI